jgi:hypothetical protein
VLDFAASKNTWLLQAPELIPAAIDPAPPSAAGPPAAPRPPTEREREAVRTLRAQPVLSVPASHPAVSERAGDLR